MSCKLNLVPVFLCYCCCCLVKVDYVEGIFKISDCIAHSESHETGSEMLGQGIIFLLWIPFP